MVSCADEWFRTQPSSLFENILRSEYQTNKQDLSQSRIAQNLEVKTINNKIIIDYNSGNNTTSIKSKFIDDFDKISSEIKNNEEEIKANSIWNAQNSMKKYEREHEEKPIVKSDVTELNNSLHTNKDLISNIQNKRKRNKILTLNESRRKLSLRADVMNKNFFRALRREIKFIFDEYLISHGFSTSKCKRTFKSNLKRYTAHILDNSSLNQTEGKFIFWIFYDLFLHNLIKIFRKLQSRHFSENIRSVFEHLFIQEDIKWRFRLW